MSSMVRGGARRAQGALRALLTALLLAATAMVGVSAARAADSPATDQMGLVTEARYDATRELNAFTQTDLANLAFNSESVSKPKVPSYGSTEEEGSEGLDDNSKKAIKDAVKEDLKTKDAEVTDPEGDAQDTEDGIDITIDSWVSYQTVEPSVNNGSSSLLKIDKTSETDSDSWTYTLLKAGTATVNLKISSAIVKVNYTYTPQATDPQEPDSGDPGTTDPTNPGGSTDPSEPGDSSDPAGTASLAADADPSTDPEPADPTPDPSPDPEPEPEPETITGSVEVTLSELKSTSTSYTLTISDVLKSDEDVKGELSFSKTYGDGAEEKSIDYGASKYTVGLAEEQGFEGTTGEDGVLTVSTENFDLKASYASKGTDVAGGKLAVEVTPKHALTEAQQVKLTLTPVIPETSEEPGTPEGTEGPDAGESGDAGDTTVKPLDVTVTIAIAKKEVDVTADLTLPYRLERDELKVVCNTLNTRSETFAVSASDKPLLDIGDVTISDPYPADEGGTVTVSGIKLSDKAQADYSLKSDTLKLTIQPIEQTTAAETQGFELSGGAGPDTWVNANVNAVYSGHTLADELDGTYVNSYRMNTAEGSYHNQLLYAKDSSNVITKVGGIAYNLDKTAPVIRSYSVGDPKARFGGALFFEGPVRDVNIAVADQYGSDASAQAQAQAQDKGALGITQPEVAVSGLVTGDAEVTYQDSHGDEQHKVSDFKLIDDDPAAGQFNFEIGGDQDVLTSSFEVTVRDVAGNVLKSGLASAQKVPENVLELVADSAAPQLEVTFDNHDVSNGRYYHANRTATIRVTEANFRFLQRYDPTQTIVTITENGQARTFTPGSFSEVARDVWQASYTFSNDSDYTLTAQVTDLVGRSSARFEESFTVDKTNPTVSVVFDNNSAANGNYYSSPRTATITVAEHNFDPALVTVTPTSAAGNGAEVGEASVGGWSSSGDTHIATVSFPGQGVYTLAVSGADQATNPMESYSCPEFVVDTVKPQVSITVNGEADGASHAYPDNASVSITVDDTNVSAGTLIQVSAVGWNGNGDAYVLSRTDGTTSISAALGDPAHDPANDGVYSVTVSAQDLAGNTESKTVDWSVNRFGSTYVLGDATRALVGGYHQGDDVPDVVVTEINPSGIKEEASSVQLSLGTSNRTLSRGLDYTLAGSEAYEGWPAYTYTIPKANFDADGTYVVTLHSTDNAARETENTMSGTGADRTDRENAADIVFTVDDTSPIVSFIGFDEPEVAEASHPVSVQLEDNIALRKANIEYGDGQHLAIDDFGLGTNSVQQIELPESPNDQTVKVTVEDMAGNSQVFESGSIFVNSDPVVRWMHNTPLFILSIVGGAVVIAAAIVGVVVWQRKSHEA